MIVEAFSRALGRVAAGRGPTDDFWYQPVGSTSAAGIAVTPDNSLQVAAVFCCVRLLAQVLATLPFRVYRRSADDPRDKDVAPDDPLWTVLHDRPNSWQTSFEWREMGMCHLSLRGNFYCQQVTGPDGLELWPLNPDRMKVEQLASGRLRYTYRTPDRGDRILTQDEVFHVRGLSLNGIVGASVLEYARNAIGLAIAEETHGSALFKNGGLPTFWIKRPAEKPWTPEKIREFRAGWRSLHAGAENAGNPPILTDGMELNGLNIANRDLQWIDGQNFSGAQICRFFGVPPHLAYFLDRATFNNIEHLSLEFVKFTVAPWCVRWEQAVSRDLIADTDTTYAKLVLDALLRGDATSRAEAQNLGIQNGSLLVNEAREMEDRNPIEGGDTPRFPLNMGPGENGQPNGRTRQTRTQPIPEPEPEPDAEETPADKTPDLTPLIRDVAERLAAAEIRGIEARSSKAANDPKKWAAHCRDFYAKHLDYCRKAIIPLLSVVGVEDASGMLNAVWTESQRIAGAADTIRTELPDLKASRVAFYLDIMRPYLGESNHAT
jgi:HK97 family phage portal protein